MEEKINSEKLEESETIALKKVQLNRSWSFWENYEQKEKSEKEYNQLLKEIYTFDNIISFWQFWNKYPGSIPSNVFFNGESLKYFFKEKQRIIAINLFEKGIRPEWEDERNKNGKIYLLEYEIKNDLDEFLKIIKEAWTKLLCITIGETIPFNKNVLGVRFVDKTKIGGYKKILFRFEIWVDKNMDSESLEQLKKYLVDEFHCPGTRYKEI